MKFDEESLLQNIDTILKAQLNAKLTAISTEKNDGITLDSVDSNAILMDTEDSTLNYDPAIIFMIVDQLTEAQGPVTSENIVVNITLLKSDIGNDNNILKKMLRYRRAIKEIIEDNFDKINPCGLCTIESLPVLSFQRSGAHYLTKVVGVNLLTSITS